MARRIGDRLDRLSELKAELTESVSVGGCWDDWYTVDQARRLLPLIGRTEPRLWERIHAAA